MLDDDALADLAGTAQLHVSDMFSQHGALVNRWIVLAEVLEDNGDRVMVQVVQDDMPIWDAQGMLTYALHAAGQDQDRNSN